VGMSVHMHRMPPLCLPLQAIVGTLHRSVRTTRELVDGRARVGDRRHLGLLPEGEVAHVPVHTDEDREDEELRVLTHEISISITTERCLKPSLGGARP